MSRNRQIYRCEFNEALGLHIAYDAQGRELARGKDGLAIVAILWDRNPDIVHSHSAVGGVRMNPDGSWRYQTITGRIVVTGVTQAEAEATGLEHKRQQRAKKEKRCQAAE